MRWLILSPQQGGMGMWVFLLESYASGVSFQLAGLGISAMKYDSRIMIIHTCIPMWDYEIMGGEDLFICLVIIADATLSRRQGKWPNLCGYYNCRPVIVPLESLFLLSTLVPSTLVRQLVCLSVLIWAMRFLLLELISNKPRCLSGQSHDYRLSHSQEAPIAFPSHFRKSRCSSRHANTTAFTWLLQLLVRSPSHPC